MTEYLGFDVHSKDTVYVGQEESGGVTGEGKVSTTVKGFCHLIKTLQVPKGTKIGLETGPQAMWVARVLSGLGMQPVVIDAREVRQKARRIGQKCDRRDAFEICDGLRRGIYTSIVYVPGPEIQRLRQILSERRYFVRVCTSQVNRAKFALRSVGMGQEATTLTTLEAWHKLLRRPAVELVRETLARHMDVWRVAREKVLLLERKLREALKPFEDTVRRLQADGSSATLGLCPRRTTRVLCSVTDTSRSEGPANCERCCAKPLTTRRDRSIP
jgi:transposase